MAESGALNGQTTIVLIFRMTYNICVLKTIKRKGGNPLDMKVLSYNTQQILIKPKHKLFDYFQMSCENSKNLANTTNFYIRQVFTGLTTTKALQPLQQEVLVKLNDSIDNINYRQQEAHNKRLLNEFKKTKSKQKPVKLNLFKLPDDKSPYITFNLLDTLFKELKQADYRSLPTQSSQGIMRSVFDDWKSFYASLKDWKSNPSKYLGRPKIPGYIKSTTKEVLFTNQDCVIKNNRTLKFPKTKAQLTIGKLGARNQKLKMVRVIPKYGQFVVELVFENNHKSKLITDTPKRVMSMDLGIDNLATITTNTKMKPILLKGKNIKSVNQYYNKTRAHYIGILRQGMNPKEGQQSSKRLVNLDAVRHRKLNDLFHKASTFIVDLAVYEKIDTIIIGQNKGWKQKSNIGKKNNQKFVQVPFSLLIRMIEYKAADAGINVIIAEESYTSQASFVDEDEIPTYRDKIIPKFSGRRINRGLYRIKNKQLINSDVNASANIMRKTLIKLGISLYKPDVLTNDPLSYSVS